MQDSGTETAAREPLKLKFVGALVEQLGAQLYPSATATVAELISNAWDADARNVWITIPLDRPWKLNDKIVVLDDGHGMTRDQAQERYLVVGRKRRQEDHGKTKGGRPVHGRKGIGKLAAFGSATILDCYTVRDDKPTSFRLDYEKIRQEKPGADCLLEEEFEQEPLRAPNGRSLAKGTRIKLFRLRLKRKVPKEQFITSMSRRFSVDQTEMKVFINGEQLERFHMDLEFQFPNKDHKPNDSVTIGDDGWGVETLEDGGKVREVRWWMGFTKKPLPEEYLRGISILARGKMLQRPFMFEQAGGTSAQLGQEYIVGEVVANWLDSGSEVEDDLIQTNRDQLQLEDERLKVLLEWGRKRLKWALSERSICRGKKAEKTLLSPEIQDLLANFTRSERQMFVGFAKKAAKIGEHDDSQMHEFIKELVNAYLKDKAMRELIERVKLEPEDFQTKFWPLVREFSLIDARRNLSIIEARLVAIESLDVAIKAGATEVPKIHNIIKTFPWLLDPRWGLMAEEVFIDKLGVKYTPEIDEETRDRLDFVFALQPSAHLKVDVDELLVVEIKRGKKSNGSVHRVTSHEVYKLHRYVLRVQDHLRGIKTTPPRISSLMIANEYAKDAKIIKTDLEKRTDVSFKFQTWSDVVENTRRLHTSWLEVTRKAAKTYSEQEGTSSS